MQGGGQLVDVCCWLCALLQQLGHALDTRFLAVARAEQQFIH